MEIDITAVVNVVLVLIALYIGTRIVALLTKISNTLTKISNTLPVKEHDHA